MELYKVRVEDKDGALKSLLVLADDALQAYDFVARPDQFVYDITKQDPKGTPIEPFGGLPIGPMTL